MLVLQHSILRLFFLLSFVSVVPAFAQTTEQKVFLQVSSHQTKGAAVAEATKYSDKFPDIKVFASSTGYFALVVAELPSEFGQEALNNILRSNLVPADTVLTAGQGYRGLVWQQDEPYRPVTSTIVAAVATEAKWNEGVRRGVQNALIWSGDYASRVDGEFGENTRRAIKQFQVRNGYSPSGYLEPAQVQLLESIRAFRVDEIGYSIVEDFQSGIRVGFPTDFFTVDTYTALSEGLVKSIEPKTTATAGSIYFISHDVFPGSLDSLFRIIKDFDNVSDEAYSAVRDDWIVVSDNDGFSGVYAYARVFGGEVKGFILVWPSSEDRLYKPLSVAMFNSLESIPGYNFEKFSKANSAEVEAPTSLGVVEKPIEPQAEPDKKDTASGFGTGFFINDSGYLLTNEHVVAGCSGLSYGRNIPLEFIASDAVRDLAILRDRNRPLTAPFASFSSAPINLNADVTVVGFPLPGFLQGLNVTRGAVSGLFGLFGDTSSVQITAPVQPGNSGGPLLDESGLVVGVVQSKLDAIFTAERTGDIPQNVNFAIRGETAKTFLSQNYIKIQVESVITKRDPVALAELAREFTVQVSCE